VPLFEIWAVMVLNRKHLASVARILLGLKVSSIRRDQSWYVFRVVIHHLTQGVSFVVLIRGSAGEIEGEEEGGSLKVP
jgi:hypothetical protein